MFTSGVSPRLKEVSAKTVIRRAGILTAAGLFVNQAPSILEPSKLLHIGSWRLPGVLQRAAVASVVASGDKFLPLGVLPVALLAVWYGVSKQWAHAPQQPFACTHATAQSRIDSAVLGASHLHQPESRFDPEGILGSVLTAPVSILLGSYFKRAMVAATTYLTGLRQPRATLFPILNTGASAHPLSQTASAVLPALGAFGTALAFAGVSSGVLTYLAPYATPASKALWTPSFVGQTTAYSIAYWAASDVLVALTRFEEVPSKIRAGAEFIVDRLETLGRMSLEGYLLSVVGSVLFTAGGESSVWSYAIRALEAVGVSGKWAGVGVSLALSVGILEAVRPLEKKGWKIR